MNLKAVFGLPEISKVGIDVIAGRKSIEVLVSDVRPQLGWPY
jgi:hypothetical protein